MLQQVILRISSAPRLKRLNLLLLLRLLAAAVVLLGPALLRVGCLSHQQLLVLRSTGNDRVNPRQTDRVVLALRPTATLGELVQAASHTLIGACFAAVSASAIVRTGQLLLDQAAKVGRIAPVALAGVLGRAHRSLHHVACLNETCAVASRDKRLALLLVVGLALARLQRLFASHDLLRLLGLRV